MWECTCGFANDDGSTSCVACGAKHATVRTTSGSLVFVNLRTKERIEVTRPGGLIGRSGDFEPDSFSPRVSRVHLVAEAHDDGPWTLEFVGRHRTELDAAGSWVEMERDQPREVIGGEKLRMADMLFRLEVEPLAPRNRNEASGFEGDDTRRQNYGPSVQDNNPCPRGEEEPEPGNAPRTDGVPEAGGASEVNTTPGADGDPVQTGWIIRCPACGASHRVESEQARVARCDSCFDPLDAKRIARCAPQPAFE